MGLYLDTLATGYEADMLDENGRIRSPLAPGQVVAPAFAEIRGERLEYEWDSPGQSRRWATQRDPEGLLGAFMGISSRRRLLAFVRKYGPLGLCDAGFPLGRLPLDSSVYRHNHAACVEAHFGEASGPLSEPLEIWDQLINRVRGVFDMAAWLHTEASEPKDDLIDRAFTDSVRVRRLVETRNAPAWQAMHGPSVSAQRIYAAELADQVNTWLEIWRATPLLQWEHPATPVLRLGTGAAQHLALQVAVAVGRSGVGWAICDGCSTPYQREERAAPRGRRNWCPQCRKDGTMGRILKRAQREKGDHNATQG